MGTIVTVIFLVVIALTFYQSFWGVVGIFGFIFAEKLAGDYVPFGDRFILLITLITGFSYLTRDVIGKGRKMKVNNDKIKILLIYIFYLAISSLDTFFTDITRNWALTYFQSFLMVILIANTVRSFEDVRKIMLGIIVFGFFCTLNYIIENWNQIFQEEIDGGANTYGRLFLIIIIFSYSFIEDLRKFKLKHLTLIGIILIILIGLSRTGSRTSFVLLIGLTVYSLLNIRKIYISQIIIGLGLLIVGYYIIPSDVINNIILSFNDASYEGGGGNSKFNSVSQNARFFLWNAGFEMLNDHNWIFGIGVGNYKHLILDYLPIFRVPYSHPHNTYISVLVESGIIGLTIFTYVVYLSFASLKKYKKVINSSQKKIMESWFLAFVIFLIGGLTKHDHYDKLFFLFIGISIAFDNMRNNAVEKETVLR